MSFAALRHDVGNSSRADSVGTRSKMGLALPLPTLGPDLCLILQGTMGFPGVVPASLLKGKEAGGGQG